MGTDNYSLYSYPYYGIYYQTSGIAYEEYDDYTLQILNELRNSSANFSMSDFLEKYMYRPEELEEPNAKHALPYIFVLIFVLGIFGNGLVVYVFFRNKGMRTVTNMYLLNLAIVDLVYLLVCVPFTAILHWTKYWEYGDVMCKLVNYLMGVSMSVSVLTLTAVGVDRYHAIIHPVTSRSYRTNKRTAIVLVVIWVTSFLLFIPILLITKVIVIELEIEQKYCVEHWAIKAHRRSYSTLVFIGLFLIPQGVIIFCHFCIARRLWRRRPALRMNNVTIATLRTRRRIAKMLYAITFVFAIAWLPLHMVQLNRAYASSPSHFFFYLELIAPCFSYATTAVNPIIYCFMSKTFRQYFKAAFTCERVHINPILLGEDPEVIANNNLVRRFRPPRQSRENGHLHVVRIYVRPQGQDADNPRPAML